MNNQENSSFASFTLKEERTQLTPIKRKNQPMQHQKKRDTLEHRFTFRTDFDTFDKVAREAKERGVSVSKHINTLLSK